MVNEPTFQRHPDAELGRSADDVFTETRWSQVVLAAEKDSEGSRLALERLCQTYWGPIYGFLRRKGKRPHDAEDLTQDFFLRLLKSDAIAGADRMKGRFRTFLLGALSHFLIDETRKQTAQKRGGGNLLAGVEFSEAEERYREVPDPGWTPEQVYDQQWAATLLSRGFEGLRKEFTTAGQEDRFNHFKVFLAEEAKDGAYDPIASELRMSRGAVSKAVQRMRIRYHQLVRQEVADTVTRTSEVETELVELFQ